MSFINRVTDPDRFEYVEGITPKNIVSTLKPGKYWFDPPNMYSPPALEIDRPEVGELLDLQGGAYDDITNYIDVTMSKKYRKHCKDMGILWKTGILLYGVPGTGKTCLVHQITEGLVKKYNALVVTDPDLEHLSLVMDMARRGNKKRTVVIVCEDCENDFRDNESDILSFLDGHDSSEGTIFIATTNYLDEIPDRIRNRPSRIGLVKEIPPLNASQRAVVLQAQLSKEALAIVDIKELAALTEGMTIDHIKAAILKISMFGLSLDNAVSEVKLLEGAARRYRYRRGADLNRPPLRIETSASGR